MRLVLIIILAIVAGLILGRTIGDARAGTLANGAVECHEGLDKLERYDWDFVSVTLVGEHYFVQLTRTEKSVSKNASSIMTISLCVVTTRPFRLSERLRVRRDRLAPAY